MHMTARNWRISVYLIPALQWAMVHAGRSLLQKCFAMSISICLMSLAWVGKVHLPTPRTTVNPSFCGEGSDLTYLLGQHIGSPPHGRGRACGCDPNLRRQRFSPACTGRAGQSACRRRSLRFTPARAGKGIPHRPRSGLAAVHLRMRGEGCMAVANSPTSFGSAPHAEGRDRCVLPRRGLQQFIPSHVRGRRAHSHLPA